MKKNNKFKLQRINLKKKYLFNLLDLFYKKHFKKLNSFLELILRKYILYLSYQSIILNLIFRTKSIFNILIELSLKKINFILQYQFNFSYYLNSFCYLFNLNLFTKTNIELKLVNNLSNTDILLRTNLNKFCIFKYLRNININSLDSYNLNTILFFFFKINYFKERTLFLSYISDIYYFYTQINILYSEIICIFDLKLISYYYYFYSFVNSNSLKVKSNYYQYLFLYVIPFFDLFNFLENNFNRSVFVFDYCPFYLTFAKNYLRNRFFYLLCVIYFL